MDSTGSRPYWGRRIAVLGVLIAVVVAVTIWLSTGGWPLNSSAAGPTPQATEAVPGPTLDPEPPASPSPEPSPEPEPEPEPTFEPSTFTLAAAGDVLPHGPVPLPRSLMICKNRAGMGARQLLTTRLTGPLMA